MMGKFLSGFVLPMLLLSGASVKWSLMSLADLFAFLFIQYSSPRIGLQSQKWYRISFCILIFSSVAILSQSVFYIVWVVKGETWSGGDAQWVNLIGFLSVESWRSPNAAYFMAIQIFAAILAMIEIYGKRFGSDEETSSSGYLHSSVLSLGSHLRVFCCLFLPAMQLIVGISHPSWASLPFFICSCVGLVNWSLTSNFSGLFWCWRGLLVYSALNIVLMYVYQLPLDFPGWIQRAAEFIGLYKISVQSGWSEICSYCSLIVFYIVLSTIRCDLSEMNFIISTTESSLTEQLLPLKNSFSFSGSRSDLRHNVLLKGEHFQNFSINFFTYGFPVSMLALSFWSFHFASFCAFGLLAYVGYILFACPSLFHLHRLNGLLLVFILFWAVSTYVFNVAFQVLKKEIGKDMEKWETIGLWHYTIPGFYLLAQFGLGVLVSLGNLVSNSIFVYLSDSDGQTSNEDYTEEGIGETKVLIVATLAWGIRKSSRAIALLLLFLIALQPGLFHAVYLIFFIVFLLCHTISTKIRSFLIILCEAHFSILYFLRLNLIKDALKEKGAFTAEILLQLGFHNHAKSGDFLKIAALACFCAIHNHGIEVLSSFSAIVKRTPSPPIGFSILRAGLIKSVLLSVCTSRPKHSNNNKSSYDNKIAPYLAAVGQKFSLVYRAYGTYIAFLTILLTVYLVRPNFVSLGYLFFLLVWMVGRQLLGKTKKRLWLPLKVYAVLVFVFIYGLNVFVRFRTWISSIVDISSAFGYNSEASMLDNAWESLAVLVVMQLYSYERRKNKNSHDCRATENPEQFWKRLLILHSEKIINVALFYASLSPISAFGFIYLIGLVICSTLPKSSWIPSRLFLVYSGFILMVEYFFQLCGGELEMFPGQKYFCLSQFLGLRLYDPGFLGIEAGLRAKVLVIVSCILQYNVFHWLAMMPRNSEEEEIWKEPCALIILTEEGPSETKILTRESKFSDSSPWIEKRKEVRSQSWPSLSTFISQGSSKDANKWSRRRISFLRKERLHMQIANFKIYLKFWIENMFNLFGLEINMLALLLASFAVLNVISLLYVALLVACIVLSRLVIRKLWPIFVLVFGAIITIEYLAIWLHMTYSEQRDSGDAQVQCRDCWKNSDLHFDHCMKCWLGIVVDDPRMLIGYYVVFMFACFKLRADHLSSQSASDAYEKMISHSKEALLNDLSLKTKSLWTILDYLRLYSYCHSLDLVLSLILITGTLEFDVLHLGYLGIALVLFRMRLQILKKKNKIFKFLRLYNFTLIVLSLVYQSPFVGGSCKVKCDILDKASEVIGFYKYDYGFRITSRSSIVEIIIFMLVSMQSYMLSVQDFDYVSEYLEVEQIGIIMREQEKRAAWRTAQLQHIRKSEEQKRLRNLQVEKMKSEMLNLQNQLHCVNTENCGNGSQKEGIRRRKNSYQNGEDVSTVSSEAGCDFKKKTVQLNSSLIPTFNVNKSPRGERVEPSSSLPFIKNDMSFLDEITELKCKGGSTYEFMDSHKKDEAKVRRRRNPVVSAVHLVKDGVSQVQYFGNKAVTNLVYLFNIKQEEANPNGDSPEDEVYYEIEDQDIVFEPLDRMFSFQSDTEHATTVSTSDSTGKQIGMILQFIWAQMRSNNDVVCYCCFILIFVWNFSLFSMVYPAVLFSYALCVNDGPDNIFWIIMLIYTEMCVIVQYVYQIIIQHCGLVFDTNLLQVLGFPEHKTKSSFVVRNWPLFLVYLFTLLQTSISIRDRQWGTISDISSSDKRKRHEDETVKCCMIIVKRLISSVKNVVRSLQRYWKCLTQGAETPPYFVQLSMKVDSWPEEGIQPEKINSAVNKILKIVYDKRSQENETSGSDIDLVSRVRVHSIEKSPENDDVALAVFEVLYASPGTECHHMKSYKSLTPAADVAYEILEALYDRIFEKIRFPYLILSVIGGGKKDIDLYAYIFCADLSVFFLVAMFYQSVIKTNSEFLEVYQLEDQFPKEFVFILMAIFFLIVLDRIIYLCSFATGKVIFYLFNVVTFTYSVTDYAWSMEPLHRHGGRLALRAIFLTKAISLALQAVQIRFGVPRESTLYRQFLTSSVSQINYLGYRIYRALPFLYELRCVLDWSCTTTSLTLYDWLKLEDIHSSLFLVKCDAELYRANHQHGEKQTKMTKFCSGICLFFVLMCVIWAPMMMYSSGNPTNIANPIKDANIRIDIRTISGRLTIFETTLCEKIALNELGPQMNLDPHGYLRTYNVKDIQLLCCQPDASTSWIVPPIVQERYTKSLSLSMDIIFSWQLTRDRPKEKEVVRYELTVQDEDLPTYSQVLEVLNGTTNSFGIRNIYPRYFRVTGSGDVRLLEQSVDLVSGNLVLNRGNPEWWSFHDIDASSSCGKLAGPMAVIVSEETPQGILGETLSKFSIWGLYITFVLAVGRFIRLQCSDLRMRIPYENLPSCERLLAICEGIYAARAEGELEVEEVLYWTLVKIYRSPHMLLEYTKHE